MTIHFVSIIGNFLLGLAMPSKANQPKKLLAQRNSHIAKATRIFSRMYRAINEEISNFNIESIETELKIILADAEESSLF